MKNEEVHSRYFVTKNYQESEYAVELPRERICCRRRKRRGLILFNYRALFAINEKSFVYEYQNPFVLCMHLHVLIVFCRSEEHTSELQSRFELVCRLLLEQKEVGQRAPVHAIR